MGKLHGVFGRGDGRLSVKSVDGGPEYVVVDVCGIGASAFGELRSGDVVFRQSIAGDGSRPSRSGVM